MQHCMSMFYMRAAQRETSKWEIRGVRDAIKMWCSSALMCYIRLKTTLVPIQLSPSTLHKSWASTWRKRECERAMDCESTPAFLGSSTQCSTLTAMYVSRFQQLHVCTVWPCLLALRRDTIASADSESNHLQAYFIFLDLWQHADTWWLVFGKGEKNNSRMIWFAVI